MQPAGSLETETNDVLSRGGYGMKAKAMSSVGKVRKTNEDFFGIYEKTPSFYMVADGMGGHKAGAVASKEAVSFVSEHLEKHLEPKLTGTEVEGILYQSVMEANKGVFEKSLKIEECSGMGTTLTVAVPIQRENKLTIAHIGDSRAYMLEKDRIYQVTRDHSLVQELVKNGDITEAEAKDHPKRNVITRALGTEDEVEPDVFSVDFTFESDYYLLLCTDGLSNAVEMEEIKKIIQQTENIETACGRLIDKANERGGQDNITVLILQGS